MTDLVLTRLRLPDRPGLWDMAFAQGRISGIAPQIDADAPRHDAAGCLGIGGFVDPHIHLDKAHILDRCEMSEPSLAAAVRETARAKAGADVADVYARAARVAESAILNGTNLLRTFVEVDPRAGMRGFDAIMQIKQDYAWAIDIQICAFAQEGLTNEPQTEALLVQALEQGADLVGGCSYRDPDPETHIDRVFALARRFGTDVDFHIDFSLDPGMADLPALIAATQTHGYGGRVVAGHVTNLSAMPPEEVARIGRDLADAGIAVIALPATDLFLMGREADRLPPRGLAPLAALRSLGVHVAVGTNNVMNPFTPYGDANALRMANLYANVAHLAAPDDLAACFDMVGDGAARLMGRHRSLAVGQPADLVLIDAPDQATAVRTLAPVRAGWRAGRQTFVKPAGQLLR